MILQTIRVYLRHCWRVYILRRQGCFLFGRPFTPRFKNVTWTNWVSEYTSVVGSWRKTAMTDSGLEVCKHDFDMACTCGEFFCTCPHLCRRCGLKLINFWVTPFAEASDGDDK